jgi:threonine/homoserine/homoserine lactone efflux protein
MVDEASFGAAVFIACIRTGNILVTVMASLGLFALFINSVLALDVVMFVGKP